MDGIFWVQQCLMDVACTAGWRMSQWGFDGPKRLTRAEVIRCAESLAASDAKLKSYRPYRARPLRRHPAMGSLADGWYWEVGFRTRASPGTSPSTVTRYLDPLTGEEVKWPGRGEVPVTSMEEES